ncbi:MAG: hypothetical protein CL946_12665 [Ectothiorhodospiraceae bacterium]|nr:hypothetical protein [Ectothiorhodospiraceae bacterium]
MCPKCNAAAFKRSSTKTKIERLYRDKTGKVPYRCHECNYRKVIDPSYLHYPSKPKEQRPEEHEEFDFEVELPDSLIGEVERQMSRQEDETAHTDPEPKKSHYNRRRTPSYRRDRLQKEVHKEEEELESPLPKKPEPELSGDLADMFTDEEGGSEKTSSTVTHSSRRMGSKGKHPRLNCPDCGADSVYRSHSKSAFEDLRKKMTDKRLYRCHRCSWRGWLPTA